MSCIILEDEEATTEAIAEAAISLVQMSMSMDVGDRIIVREAP